MQEHLAEMQAEIKSGTAQLLDVREQEEWDEGHLKSATLVPLSKLNEGESPSVDANVKTYLHCRSGGRVHMAAPILADMGFSDVIPLNEGFEELVQEGFEPEE
jgi:rhodanese-related sulfurtransferase